MAMVDEPWWIRPQPSLMEMYTSEILGNFNIDKNTSTHIIDVNTEYFHGQIVYDVATNQIKIYDSNNNEFLKINIDTDLSKKPTGIKINNIPIDLNTIDKEHRKNFQDNNLYYGTKSIDLKKLT
jgi:hypothetical protein